MDLRRWSALALIGFVLGCGAEPGSLPAAVCGPSNSSGVTPVESVAPKTPAKPKAATSNKTTKPKPKSSAKTSAPAGSSAQNGSPSPADSGTSDPVESDGNQLLREVRDTSFALNSFKAVLDSSEYRWDKTRNPMTTNIALTGKQPGWYRFEMIKSTKSSNNGAKLVYQQGSTKVAVKPGGILSLLTVNFNITDQDVLTDNNYRLDQITLEGVLNRVTGDGYKAEVAGSTTLGGEKITVLKVTNPNNSLDPHADYEYVGFDSRKYYRLWTVFAKKDYGIPNNILHRIAITSFTPNAEVAADAFKL